MNGGCIGIKNLLVSDFTVPDPIATIRIIHQPMESGLI